MDQRSRLALAWWGTIVWKFSSSSFSFWTYFVDFLGHI